MSSKDREKASEFVDIGLIASAVGHELKNPLNATLNAVFYLKDALKDSAVLKEDPTAKEMLDLAEKELRAIANLITDLLSVSRVVELDPRTINLRELIQDARRRLAAPKVAKRLRILMADDDADLRGLMRDVLSMEGFELWEAADGAQCIEKAKEKHPDVIFLDADMPRINGWDVCKKLKNSPSTKAIPIVMISAHSQREDKEKALSYGASFYLPKPVDVDVLIPLIRKLGSGSA